LTTDICLSHQEKESREVRFIYQVLRDEDGQDLVEYGVLIVGVSFLALVGANALGAGINGWYSAIAGALPNP
jgi:Flp pilus assembly pilin Flp